MIRIGRQLSATWDNGAEVSNLAAGCVREGHSGRVKAATVTPDGMPALSRFGTGTPTVWNLDTALVCGIARASAAWASLSALDTTDR